MTYLKYDGKFYNRYMYFDAVINDNYVSDSLFYKRRIPVKFGNEYTRDNDKYRAIFCKVRKKYHKAFEEALEEIKTKMELLGFLDYEDYCTLIIKEIEES